MSNKVETASTVIKALDGLRQNLELTPTELEKVIARKDNLIENLLETLNIDEDTVFLSGSYDRMTRIRPLNDIDVFVVLHDDEKAKYRNVENGASKLLTKIKDQVKSIADYSRSDVKVDGQAVTLTYSDGFGFDIVPAFVLGSKFEIPHSPNAWTTADPKGQKTHLSDKNAQLDGRLVPLVKMIKQWNVYHGRPVNSSYYLELLCNQSFPVIIPTRDLDLLIHVFNQLQSKIMHPTIDPVLGSWVGDHMTTIQREAAKKKLAKAEQYCKNALAFDTASNVESAIAELEHVFGDSMPAFESTVAKSLATRASSAFEYVNPRFYELAPIAGPIVAHIKTKTGPSRSGPFQTAYNGQRRLPPNIWLEFTVEHNGPADATIEWEVVNNGMAAYNAGHLGHVRHSSSRRNIEHTKFKGVHHMVCTIKHSGSILTRVRASVAIQ
jgi:Second Messenger Oligonucleotide or Dinucleotide Synthetase domain/Adenylyl/Guanylyl and SMODS C-terminal sensor domain